MSNTKPLKILIPQKVCLFFGRRLKDDKIKETKIDPIHMCLLIAADRTNSRY